MYKSKSPSLSTSARALDVDPGLFSFDSNFFSTKIPFPSFINTLFGPPSAVTIKSKSLSPSTSAKTEPFEYLFGAATPAAKVKSSNCHSPLLI